jgi:hypothetical protein
MLCKKCTNDIPELHFSEEVLLEMRSLSAHNFFVVK